MNSKTITMPVNKKATQNADSTKAASGSGMDKKIAKQKSPVIKVGFGLAALLIVAFIYQIFTGGSTSQSLTVEANRIVISEVSVGAFEDFIPIRGRVMPAKTLYLDAIEGGRVERILVEDGAELTQGQLIVELSNASLQLNVLGNEARVAEQLNNMRTIELSLEQNRLQHKRNLADIQYQIKMLSRQLNREQQLLTTGAIQESQVADTKDTLDWYKQRLALTLESQASDTRMQEEQLKFLTATSQRLEDNLAISRQNLDNMLVRAPVAGKLSGFNVEVGQSIGRGERLGQIDTPNDFKLTALIDEFYLGRVDLGQQATLEHKGTNYQLAINKIYPQVNNGQFEVDLKFVDVQPQDIRRGQTKQTKLTLGDATSATLIPNGAFFQDTGGNWIFVVSQDGSEAIKRPVRLGRRNSRFIEVLEGLEPGERVVTSPYSSYQDMTRLKIN